MPADATAKSHLASGEQNLSTVSEREDSPSGSPPSSHPNTVVPAPAAHDPLHTPYLYPVVIADADLMELAGTSNERDGFGHILKGPPFQAFQSADCDWNGGVRFQVAFPANEDSEDGNSTSSGEDMDIGSDADSSISTCDADDGSDCDEADCLHACAAFEDLNEECAVCTTPLVRSEYTILGCPNGHLACGVCWHQWKESCEASNKPLTCMQCRVQLKMRRQDLLQVENEHHVSQLQ